MENWNKNYREKILEIHKSGITSPTEIAKIVGCAKSTVHYHLNDKDPYKRRVTQRRYKQKEWFKELTKDDICIICGEDERVCIDYHHLFPEDKRAAVSVLVDELRSKEVIIKELEKCIPICSNCHRKVHANLIDLENYI